MACRFKSIESPATATVRDKMSRFIATATPVDTAAGAMEVIARTANEYHDARHVCWAYSVGPDADITASNDNGEPSGTAGRPILGQIRSAGITNVVITVVRYFGGIKLGTSGLIAAYREAARQAIAAGRIVECSEMARMTMTYGYEMMGAVMTAVKEAGARVVSRTVDNVCSLTLELPSDAATALAARLADAPGVSTSTVITTPRS